MVFIKDLTNDQKIELCNIIKKDNFKNIIIHSTHISFTTDGNYRYFELYSTSLKDLNFGINIDLLLSEQYKEKIRFTNALHQELEESDQYNIDQAIINQNWKLLSVIDKKSLLSKWSCELFCDDIYVVEITNDVHFIINEKVYEGNFDSIDALASVQIEELLQNTQLLTILEKD